MLKLNSLNGKSVMHSLCSSYVDLTCIKRCKHDLKVKKWYQTLGVSEDCEDETLKSAFVFLVKRFHPDSGSSEASAVKFSEIQNAYRQIRKLRMEGKINNPKLPEVKEVDIKHTAPQHRHYLDYNIGTGTPSKRQKLYTMEKAQKAIDNVTEHRLKKLQADERNTLVGMDKQRAKDIKTRFGMDRLVEDLIQEAMNKGEFNDLPGMGKPLKENTTTRNPYVDFVTYKLNEILIENGFTPEWIQLSKEIREQKQDLRKQLIEARNYVGFVPLSAEDETTWKNILDDLNSTVNQINKKIDKYNLLVPVLQKQMFHVKLDKLAQEVLAIPPKESKKYPNSKSHDSNFTVSKHEASLFDMIFDIFNKKSP